MDLSTLSNDDLLKLYGQSAAPAPAPAPAAPAMDFSGISDEELRKMHGRALMAPQPTTPASMLSDVGKTILPGLTRGAAGVVGFPQASVSILEGVVDYVHDKAYQAFGATPPKPKYDFARASSGLPSQEQVLKPVEEVTGPLYKPKTIAGEYTNTLAEFAPNALLGPTKMAQRFWQVAAPALFSETAGQAARVALPEAEPYARFGGALAGGIGAAVAQAPRGGNAVLREGLHGVTPDELTAAQNLRAQARELPNGGIDLPLDEALAQVTNGRTTRLSQISRVVTHSGGPGAEEMSALYARRPDQIDKAARGTFDMFGPLSPTPSAIGLDVQAAARAGLAQTPEGMALTQARTAAGPRMTADQAGQVIQPALRAQADLRDAVRSGQAARDYRLAREAPESAGIERQIQVERPGEPIVTHPAFDRPQFTEYAPRPLEPFAASSADAALPAGESLARFVAKHGGLKLDGDAAATDLHRFVVPGLGKVARPDGKSLDNFWRERLFEEGYFRPGPGGDMSRDITSELLRKLQNEQRGFPSYPLDSAGKTRTRAVTGREADDYANAKSLAETRLRDDLAGAGIDPKSVHPDIQSRALGALMRGEHSDPLQAYEATVSAMKGPLDPYVKSTTVAETIPDVRFGQVNPQPALDTIEAQSRFAKGDVRSALGRTERDLYEPGGAQVDMSVQGLLKARERLDFQINDAFRAGDRTKAADLQATRSALDAQLKQVPEVATADANFAANSRPLEPFTAPNAPLARAVQRDDLSGRMAMPAEQVPGLLQGPSAMRELMVNASPAAREAQGRYLTTKIMDSATDARGNIDADKLALAMRDNSDVLAQMPEVGERIQRLFLAQSGMARIEATPLGQLTKTAETRAAADTLFPRDPLAGSQGEIGGAMGAVSRNSPRAANDITRQFFEGLFNSATKDLKGVAPQYGGAGFASRVRGNSQQAQNLDAALGALPNGSDKSTIMDRFLTALEATGYRPQKGSDTAFNTEIRKLLAHGTGPLASMVTDAAASAAMGGVAAGTGGAAGGAFLSAKKGINESLLRHRVQGSGAEIARLLLDPSVPRSDLLALLRQAGTASDAQLFLSRMVGLGNSGSSSGNLPSRPAR